MGSIPERGGIFQKQVGHGGVSPFEDGRPSEKLPRSPSQAVTLAGGPRSPRSLFTPISLQ